MLSVYRKKSRITLKSVVSAKGSAIGGDSTQVMHMYCFALILTSCTLDDDFLVHSSQGRRTEI